jgi:asparagine synthase (glutamine-hydrolysing)
MCGIAGKIYFDRERPVNFGELQAMASTMIHRGPDGEGIWIGRNVGLAHRRLAIIDLSASANQPMCNEDGSVWITFNGEIYNFQELRQGLERRGHTFRTNSDTEVIIHMYEEYGRACLERLRGMFAFAIWDSRSRTLFLARDRVGKKPLFYFMGRDRFLFASEIKALLTDNAIPRQPDPVAIDHFLALGYVAGPRTAFLGIQKLLPAHWLEVKDGQVETGRYWKLSYTPKRRVSIKDAVSELHWHLAEAVRLRLVSDVPLGAFLSGGVDSSAVVIHMAEAMNRPVRTFSVGFGPATFDERPFAREVAERYGTNHTELVVEAPVTDIVSRLVWHYDEPFGDSSAVPSDAIAELTRQHVTVVLNGDGADETFAGYDWYKMDRLVQRGEAVPLEARRWFSDFMQRLPANWRQKTPLWQIARLAEVLALPPARRYAQWVEHFGPEARQQIYTAAFKESVGQNDPDTLFASVFTQREAEDWLDVVLDADVNFYLADDLLVKMDRATMSHSLEARSPFLDHVFIEFAASLPVAYKQAWGQKKRILKTALRGRLSDELLDRPKMGFSVPIAEWLRGDLREMAHDVLLSPRTLQRDYFNKREISRLLREHCVATANHGVKLWDCLMLELWHRTFIDAQTLVSQSCSNTYDKKDGIPNPPALGQNNRQIQR